MERDDGAHQRELIMINDEALVQTKSLSTQLSLTTNQRNPGCLVIAGNTGNVVCNTSFTDLSDSRAKTEMAEADVAELQQLFDSVGQAAQAPGHERGPEAGLCLKRLRRNKVEEFDGHRPVERRHGDGYSRLLSHQRAGGCARASRPGWARWKPGRPSRGRRPSRKRTVFRPPRSRGTLISSFLGQQCCFLNGGAEGPGRRLQRAGPAEAVPTCKAARPRRDAGHGLRGAVGRPSVTSPLSRTSGMLPVTGPSNMFTYVFADALVQSLFRKARPAPRCNVTQFDLTKARPAHDGASVRHCFVVGDNIRDISCVPPCRRAGAALPGRFAETLDSGPPTGQLEKKFQLSCGGTTGKQNPWEEF